MGRPEFIERAVGGWAKIVPDRDFALLGIMQKLIWCGRLAEGLLDEVARKSGLRKRGDYEVLALIRRSEPNYVTAQDIATSLMVSPSGMTGRIDRLEKRKLVERSNDPDDRRAVRLRLTGLGRETVDTALMHYLDLYEQLLDPLTMEQAKDLDSLLEILLSEIEATRLAEEL